MLPTAPPLVVDSTVEDVVDENGSGRERKLSSAARNAHEKMEISTNSVCMTYEVLF